jgi:hypothetical protein
MVIPFWIKDPSILINKDYFTDFWPTENMTRNQKLNAISRLIIVLTLVGFLLTQTFKILATGIITLAIIVILYFVQNNKTKNANGDDDESEDGSNMNDTKEGFESMEFINNNFTNPTKTNPLMNVALTEYIDDPEREAAAPAFNENVISKINEQTKDFVVDQFDDSNSKEKKVIKDRLFADLGDNFEFDQSMRNFYATPNTQIPNDQKAFADYCYGDMISCKEGDPNACERNNQRWING